MGEFRMPALGADMAEGTLTEWLVSPGDRVTKGDPVAVIETAKSAIEVECFESGTVARLLAEPGTVLPVGAALAIIEPAAAPRTTADATPPTAAASRAETPEAARPPLEAPLPTGTAGVRTAEPPAVARGAVRGETGPLVRRLAAERGVDLTAVRGSGRGGRVTRADVEHAAGKGAAVMATRSTRANVPRVRATPYARRLAAELSLDLAVLTGTGENGAVTAADVREHLRGRVPGDGRRSGAQATEPAATRRDKHDLRDKAAGSSPEQALGPATTTTVRAAAGATARADRATAMRRAIAELMSRSKREIPHYYLSSTFDLGAAADWLRAHNHDRPVGERLVPAALLLKATALAVHEVPRLNGFWREDGFVPGDGVHLGIAVSLRDGGLLTPVIHDADALPPAALMARLKDVVRRARTGRLRGTDVSGATLTVSNLGEHGAESVYGVIHPPQVALVGFGTVVERPWAVDGLIGVRPVVTATLSADHRASDGATGARFLTTVGRLLRHPEKL
ncbi:dihydrolipoamide acetyltransferase family protein [Streptomyces flavofungini]|uniref:dihydrolipoamide acetyltransferase family protein n=1 Tax=Streptomyces flavofungini TaxID=68200 RepID=UPI0025B1488F|nr:dihydrolipoamide acetyltransferase family protein [Streptomyces flavofungini]WJV44754.1 dihydrolipoamide acetyltransferase family protein [Streptomyces flavofungini]